MDWAAIVSCKHFPVSPFNHQKQRRSNEELAEALLASPGDEDYEAALKENEAVIGKREALLEELRKELRGLKASVVQAVNDNLAALDLQPVAVPVAGATSNGGPRMGLDVEEEQAVEGREEKAEGVYL